MTLRPFKSLAAAAVLLTASVTASAASAATVVLTQSYDLTTANPSTSTSLDSFNNTGFSPALNFGTPLVLTDGDKLDYRLSFLSNQALQLTNFLGGIQLDIVATGSGTFAGTSDVLSLFDTSGTLIKSFNTTTFNINTGNNLGEDFFQLGVPLNATIGSLEFVSTNISGLGGPRNFGFSQLAVNTSTPTTGTIGVLTNVTNTPHFGGAGAVPEPATWAFLVTGFLGVGAMLRRRRVTLAA